MSRALARITHDEVARMVKAVRSCGLHVTRVQYDGQKVDVFVAETVENIAPAVDAANDPSAFSTMDEYRAWRDRERAGRRA